MDRSWSMSTIPIDDQGLQEGRRRRLVQPQNDVHEHRALSISRHVLKQWRIQSSRSLLKILRCLHRYPRELRSQSRLRKTSLTAKHRKTNWFHLSRIQKL